MLPRDLYIDGLPPGDHTRNRKTFAGTTYSVSALDKIKCKYIAGRPPTPPLVVLFQSAFPSCDRLNGSTTMFGR
jgi:hypothetical protein